MIDWNDLRHFLELARHGRLGPAAERLQVDQTTVSRRVGALEEALGAKLFDRSPGGYALTEAGQRLLSHAEAMETQSIALYQALAGKDLAFSGTVRIATPEAFGSQFLARHANHFRERHPAIELELVAETRYLSLTKREADIAVTLARPTTGRLVARKLTDYRLQIYAAPHYLRRFPPIRQVSDLADHDFIWYVDDLLQFSELKLLERTFKDPRVVFRSTNVTGQANACAAGVGLALLPCFLAAGRKDLEPVLPREASADRSFWISVHSDLRHLARVDAVYRFLTELCERHKPLLMGNTE